MKRRNADPLVKAHSSDFEAVLSPTSVELLRDPRALRLLVELGFHWISTPEKRQLIPRQFYVDCFESESSAGVWWWASAHTCTCRGFRRSRRCRHVTEMKRREKLRDAAARDDSPEAEAYARKLDNVYEFEGWAS